jgi:DNA polymerase III subunit epsilon
MTADLRLVIDTETNGLFDFSKPADAPGQPRLASLAMLALMDDTVWMKVHAYVRPDGWEMSPETTAINGLTTEKLAAQGLPVADLLRLYGMMLDQGYVVVAFNASFDLKVMRGELRRAKMADRYEDTPYFCPMVALVDVCQLPKPSGKRGYKFPKLSEAMAHFGLPQTGAHSALKDAESALALFREMKKRGLSVEPVQPKLSRETQSARSPVDASAVAAAQASAERGP